MSNCTSEPVRRNGFLIQMMSQQFKTNIGEYSALLKEKVEMEFAIKLAKKRLELLSELLKLENTIPEEIAEARNN